MSKEIAKEIVEENNIQRINSLVTNLHHPETEFDFISLIYEISLIKPDLLECHLDDIAICLNSNNSAVHKFTLLTFSNLANKKWKDVWDYRERVCDIITEGDFLVLESGLSLFLEMAKFGNSEIRSAALPCISVILEILPVENLQKFTKVIAESDILFKAKNLTIIEKRTKLL
ncbi:hypothetical protein [Flavobacterium sp. UBA7680]|uniref:hypothetical protein n=1 Tax=Flavobacterium sp. UBA7680 TaxID=1946559 RepID=UPI0025BA83FF|nr:hypothetical protein [Flavobacterium sp. UBA7680]